MKAVRLFQELTSVPTAPFYEQAVTAKALGWIRRELGSRVKVRRHRGGVAVRYQGAGPGPALCLAAHLDHPAFHLSGSAALLRGGLVKDLLPGAPVEAFAAVPRSNTPVARGTLGKPREDAFPVVWSHPPQKPRPAFATLALTPFEVKDGWLSSRSIDDLLGCAVSLEALRVLAAEKAKTNVTVLLHRAEEVGFIGALDLIAQEAVSLGDSVLSVETSRELPDAVPGNGPVIRLGDKASLFDPNLIALLDSAAERIKACQRARLTGGTCEATAYLAFGYEAAGVAIPLVNYHNGGEGRVEPEKVRLSDVDGCVALLAQAGRLFPEASLRGRMRARLSQRHKAALRELK